MFQTLAHLLAILDNLGKIVEGEDACREGIDDYLEVALVVVLYVDYIGRLYYFVKAELQ